MTQAAPAAVADAGEVPAAAVPAQDLAAHHAPLADALKAAAARVLDSGRYILGAPASASGPFGEVHAFEDEMATAMGVSHAVGMSSGTDALLAMLMATGVQPGDEVVTTPFSFIASATSIARLGARPVFADVDPTTLNLDPAAAIAKMGPRTKAVLTVHLFGRAAPCESLTKAGAARGISLLGDAAQAIGATDSAGVSVAALGRGAALSFFPTKNLGGFGDGGMVLTNDPTFATHLRLLRTHGAGTKFQHTALGGNFRLDELQAALLRVKLPHLSAWTLARRRAAARYHQLLSDLPLGLPPADAGCVWNQFVVRVPSGRRDDLLSHLARHRIAAAIYYLRPLHLQPCFAALGYRPGEFPIAEQAASEVLALPMYPELTDGQIQTVAQATRAFFA